MLLLTNQVPSHRAAVSSTGSVEALMENLRFSELSSAFNDGTLDVHAAYFSAPCGLHTRPQVSDWLITCGCATCSTLRCLFVFLSF